MIDDLGCKIPLLIDEYGSVLQCEDSEFAIDSSLEDLGCKIPRFIDEYGSVLQCEDSEFAIDSSLEEDDSGSDDSSEVNIYSSLNIF